MLVIGGSRLVRRGLVRDTPEGDYSAVPGLSQAGEPFREIISVVS